MQFKILDKYANPNIRMVGRYVEVEGNTYEVEVYYIMGGYSYLNGRTSTRGYYFSITPATRSTSNGVQWSESHPQRGIRTMLQASNRYSETSLQRIAYNVFYNLDAYPLAVEIMEEILKRDGVVT